MAVVLMTTAIALLVAGLSLLVTNLYHDRRSWGDDLTTAGSMLALATAPALSFDDRDSADRSLAALGTRPSIRTGALYTPDGQLYSRYLQPGEPPLPLRPPALTAGLHFDGGRAELIQPILQNGEPLGTIYLRAHYDVAGRILTYLGVLALVMILGLVAALLAATWLQKVITRPLGSIASVARQIVEAHEYSARAAKTTDDEFALVIDDARRDPIAHALARADRTGPA